MKIAIIGGHFSPALAVIAKLPKGTEIIFIGRKYGLEGDKATTLEYQTIIELGIPFYNLRTGRLQRHLTRHTIPSLIKMPMGFFQALSLLKKTKPDVILGFGGYLSVPVAYAGKVLGIPVVIHEQTLGAGLANKLIAPFATTVCLSWRESRRFFPKARTVLTGNPVRKDIINPQTPDFADVFSYGLPVIYVTGGSAGSHAINLLIEGTLPELLRKAVVIHQTGDAKEFGDFDRLSELQPRLSDDLKKRYVVRKFINPQDVGYIMKHADLVIGRSGINTVTELLWLKKPAILIPLPVSQAQEQRKNAYFLKDLGLAEVVEQDKITSSELLLKITSMLEHIKMYTIKDDAKSYEKTSTAADNIIHVCLSAKGKKENRETAAA